MTITELQAGSYPLELTGLVANCSVGTSTPFAVTVAAGETKQVSVTVTCLSLLSRRNGKIVFTSGRGAPETVTLSEIYVMNADGTNQTQLTSNGRYNSLAEPSRDGSKIAWGSGIFGGDTEIYVMNPNGTGVTRLTNEPGLDANPAWSPDGRTIAFGSDRAARGRGLQLHVMNSDGTAQTRLTLSLALNASWSADGRKIAFTSFVSNALQIRLVNADGSGEKFLVDGSEPAWSPDGAKIAFNRGRSIYVMNADGTGQTQLTTTSIGSDGGPSWSPDGMMIAFNRYAANTGSDSDIYVMKADGTGQTALTKGLREYAPRWGPQQP